MKLLLTSGGLTNQKIIQGLSDLVKKPFKDLNLAFIPTAANVESGGKEWLIDDLINCKKLNFKQLDIVDISAVSEAIWQPRLEQANILFFGGGNTHYLMEWVEKSGLKVLLTDWIRTKTYIGSSAGSMITGQWWLDKHDAEFYDEPDEYDKYSCLGYVDFHIMPHLNSEMLPKVRISSIQKLASEIKETIYALDDNSAVKVAGDKIEVISTGSWKRFN